MRVQPKESEGTDPTEAEQKGLISEEQRKAPERTVPRALHPERGELSEFHLRVCCCS